MKKIANLIATSLFTFSALLTIFSVSPALAQTNPCTNTADPVQCSLDQTRQAYPIGAQRQQSIPDLVHTIINWALYIAAIAAVLVIIFGGFLYITSAGNDAQAKKGRVTLTNAIIGLVIVVLSYIIVQVVYNFLVS